MLAAALAAMALIPLAEMLLRTLHSGLPGSAALTQHLTLVVGMVGAAIAAREGRLLAISGLHALMKESVGRLARIASSSVTVVVAGALCVAAVQFVLSEREAGRQLIHGLPVWFVQLFLPVGFGLIAVRSLLHASKDWGGRFAALVVAAILLAAVLFSPVPRDTVVTCGLIVLAAAIVLGAPVFVALGGAALLLGAFDCSIGHDVLLGQSISGMEREFVCGRDGGAAPGASGIEWR